jgi:hypothetical protein
VASRESTCRPRTAPRLELSYDYCKFETLFEESFETDIFQGIIYTGFIGPVYTTAINLTILQLESGSLPIYQR